MARSRLPGTTARPRPRCPSCRAVIGWRARFCSQCGVPVAPLAAESGGSLQVAGFQAHVLSENRRLASVLFADLSGSTALGERLDPEDLRGVLGRFFAALTAEIQRFGGTVDKYIGDAVMAVFGAPVSHEDDPVRAVAAALAMHRAVLRLDEELERQHGPRLELRIGINTGEVVAGLLAGATAGTYTIVGDTVNTAQRIQSAAALGDVLVSDSTYRLARHRFTFQAVPPLELRGKAEPQPAYRVLAARGDELEAGGADQPFVGRGHELARLEGALARAQDGAGQLVTVSGEAGTGKSRLVQRFLTGLPPGAQLIGARAASFASNTPYRLIGRLVRAGVEIQGDAGGAANARAALERAFGGLRPAPEAVDYEVLLDLIGYAQPSRMAAEEIRRRILKLLRQWLAARCASGPLVLVLEDLHWVDPASAEVLAELAYTIRGLSCLLLGTTRPGWLAPWPGELLELQALGDTEAEAVLTHALGGVPDEALREMVLLRAGGNPFFVEQLVESLRATDVLLVEDGRVSLQPGAAPRVPSSVHELLQARLDALEAQPRQVVQPAAVVGRTFARAVLEQLVAAEDVSVGLAALEHESLVRLQSLAAERQQQQQTYVFQHALIQEVAYQSQLLARRRELHGQVGQALETLYADRLDEYVDTLAFHYSRSADNPRALVWLLRAADRARALYANHEALQLYQAALERAADGGVAPLDAGSILERMGDVYVLIGRHEDALTSFRAARQRGPSVADAAASARLLRKVGAVLRVVGNNAAAVEALDAALAALDGVGSELEVARIAAERGQLEWRRGDYVAAQHWLQRAVDTGTALGSPADDVLAAALRHLGNVAVQAGTPEEAVGYLQRAREPYERLGDLGGIADVHSNLGTAYGRAGQWDDCLRELQASLALRERIGHALGVGTIHNNIGELRREQGELGLAIAAYQQAIQVWREVGYLAGVATALAGLGAARVEAGDAEQGRQDLLAAQAQLQQLGSSLHGSFLHRYLALANLALGNVAAAEADIQQALERAREKRARHDEAAAERVRGQIALAMGDREQRRLVLQAARSALAELGEAGELARTEAALRQLDG